MKDAVEKIASEFFEKLWADYSELSVQEEAENIYRISLKSEDSHLLIWPHGKNLEVLTHILKLLIAKLSEWHINLHVEVNDYLEKKDEKLLSFIASKIHYVKDSGKDVVLPFFTAYERKKVHSFVSQKWGSVYTESRWEGKDRRIHLCKQEEKMTIDLDGDDI